jgi:FhaA, N-terminal domain/FHA domain
MNLLKSVETTIANLVEGAFGRVFRSEVRPMELARKLAREMDAHRTFSVSRVYVPNEYAVWLSPQDRARYEGIEHEVADELCAYLLEHARREELIMASQPHVTFHTDEDLALGEFGIQASLVRPAEHAEEASAVALSPEEDEHGNTMIYSASTRARGSLERAGASPRPPRALLAVGARRLLVPPEGGVVGRSRDCAIVLEDAGVSRHHAELRPDGDHWTIEDLGSTNGVLLNGREIHGATPLREGDRLELGSTEIVFELG